MCQCLTLPVSVSFPETPSLQASLRHVASGNWVDLKRCSDCGAHWVVDVADKYQPQLALRIPSAIDWEGFDLTSARKDFLLRSRGGVAGGSCLWHGCSAPQVRGVVYCLEHLYATGART